jgi:hypothetical protein
MFWFKERSNNILDLVLLKILAAEDVDVGLIGLFTEVTGNITCLYQLHQGISFLIAGTEHDDLGIAVGYHTNIVHKRLGKPSNMTFTSDGRRPASLEIEDQMFAPRVHPTITPEF